MRLSLILAALGFCGVMVAPSTAEAGPKLRWGVHVGSGGVSFGISNQHHGHRRYRHSKVYPRHRAPRCSSGPSYRYRRACATPRRVWVPPVYRTVFAGYDRCGNPIYHRVLVREGYYKRVHYR